MSNASPENLGRACQAGTWQSIQLFNQMGQVGFSEARAKVTTELMQPADNEIINFQGLNWERHECQRCKMGILLSTVAIDGIVLTMIDITKGTCTSPYGKQTINQYPTWRRTA